MIKKSKKNSGFTLAELVLSIAIMAIISASAIFSIGNGGREQALLRAAQNFAFNVRKAQNLALSPKKYGVNPVCFYGVHTETPTQYFIYYHDQSPCPAGTQYNPGQSTKLETIIIEGGANFSGTSLNRDISFEPPEPITYFDGATGFATEKNIFFTNSIGSTRQVNINKFGNVSVQ